MDITATLYWAPAVLNGTVSAACACKRGRWCAGCGRKCLPLGPPKPNIPEDNCVGHCSVGHIIRLPGCCFVHQTIFMPLVCSFCYKFGPDCATSAYDRAFVKPPPRSSKPCLLRLGALLGFAARRKFCFFAFWALLLSLGSLRFFCLHRFRLLVSSPPCPTGAAGLQTSVAEPTALNKPFVRLFCGACRFTHQLAA